ncbi:hypothetical protein LH128_19636 [Sphingomonas sp. LH128]|uniref:outer membrane protein n=1 Tax=Sphingomonas sp. LH128 TaxID=473781 RepID=UPI00027CC56F|nr:porin family protein [Sphingomonas sp. LH128]EJU11314.1 hypothetical protein LH128_19636 [Sphingomonas sp. LH128]
MKNLLVPALLVAAAASPAAAQTFDGPYAGIEAGWNQTKIDGAHTDIGRVDLDKSRDSVRAGIFAGYNYRANDRVVLSAEGGFSLGFDDQVTRSGSAGLTSIDPEYAFNVGARAGYLVTPETLLYARGGYENLRASVRRLDAGGARYDKDSFDGWSVGGGVERAITQRVSARVEYRYSDLGGGGTKFDRHQALAGVAYHF